MSPTTSGALQCPSCGYPDRGEALVCDLCGFLLRHDGEEDSDSAPAPRRPTHGLRRPSERRGPRVIDEGDPEIWEDDEPVRLLDHDTRVALAVGALLAPVFLLTPLLKFMGWFFASLCHEMGHCAAAWYAGCPAHPAISLKGHAVALHGQPVLFLSLAILAALVWFAWHVREDPRRRLVAGALILTYPIVAWTPAREIIFLLAGQGGELAFAGVFLYRALSGGFTSSRTERILYAACAFFLLGRNLWLDAGIIFSPSVRSWYLGSGSFGLTNDYVRVAGHHLRIGLSPVAAFMLLLTLATPLVVWLVARRRLGPA